MTTNTVKNVIHSAMRNLFRKEIALLLLVILATATTALAQDGVPTKQPPVTPVPIISQLSPVSVAPGGPDLTLTVRGTNFTFDCVVQWNGTPLVTTLMSSLTLTAVVPAALTASGGTGQISVLATDAAPVVSPVRGVRPSEILPPPTVVSNVMYFPVGLPLTAISDFKFGHAAGIVPDSLAAADFNNDGNLDLAVVNEGDETVSILMGQGDGTFLPATQPTITVAANPFGIATGDLNGDGNTDLVIGNASTNGLSIALGDGTGAFTVTNLPGGSCPQYPVLADVNEDGFLDIVVGNECGNGILVYLGKGDGTFLAPATVTASGVTDVYQLVVADFDNDGNLDIAAAASEGSLIYFFKGTGMGTFNAPTTYAAVSGAWAIATGDFDGNGALDLAVSSINNNGIVILLGYGDGTFTAPSAVTSTGSYFGIVAGDLTIDGNLDLVTLASNGFLQAWPGLGGGAFGEALSFGSKAKSDGIALGNFLTAGTLDVATTSANGFNVFVPTVRITPPFAAFGSVNVGSAPQLVLTVTNTTVSTVTVSSLSIGGTNPSLFTETDTCANSDLSPGRTCAVTVTFTPVDSGSFPANLVINDNAPGFSQTVNLSGTGVGIPVASLSVTTIAFGNENIGVTSNSMPVTLTNTGTGPLTGLALSITGTNTGDFSQSSNCEDTLAVSASCTVNVTFTPSAVGARTASLQIADNASNSPQAVALTGSGVDVATQLLYIDAPPAQIMAGSSIGTITVGVYDAQAVLITSATTPIRVTITGPNFFFQGLSASAVSGVATFDSTLLLDAAGQYTITAQVNDAAVPSSRRVIRAGGGGLTPAVAYTQVVPQNSSIQMNVSGYPSPTFTGFPHTFTVSVTDAFNNPITTYAGTVTLTSSDPAAVLTPSPYTFVSGDMGAHIFAGTLNTVGTQSITATDVPNSLSGSQTGIVVNAAPQIVVNTLADDAGSAACDGNEPCSFRSAATVANNAGEGAISVDTSQFQGTPPFIATLSNGVIVLTGNISITGPSSTPLLIISGGNGSAIFQVNSGAVVTISSLSLTGGFSSSDGGAISNAGTLTLSNAQVSGSLTETNGGAIANTGTMTITGSTVVESQSSGSGGGIANSGTLTITGSAVNGSSATLDGGAFLNSGTLTVNTSTISGNSSNVNGGAVSNSGTAVFYDSTINGNEATALGGAIDNSGSLSLPQSTIYSNTAVDGSAIENEVGGTMVLLQCTVTQNLATGGTSGTITNLNGNSGAVKLLNSIDAGNSSGSGGDCVSCGSQSSFNVFNVTAANLGLGGLANNAGPTETVLPQAGSSVLGAGSVPLIAGANLPQSFTYDQRGSGFPRVVNNMVDLGAVETQQGPPATALLLEVDDSAVAGQPISVTVTAVTQCSDPATSFTDTVHFTSSDPLAVLPGDYTFVSDDAGAHVFSVTFKTSGAQTLTVTDVQHPLLTATQSVSVSAGPAATIVALAGSGQTATPGSTFAIALEAKVIDAFANPIPAIPIIFTAPTTGASGTFAGGSNSVTINTLSTGIATATAFTANNTAGQYTVTAGMVTQQSTIKTSVIRAGAPPLNPASFTLTNGATGVTPSYTVTANPATLTIVQGQSGTTVLTFTPVGGFAGTVSLSCSGLPADADCVFVPAQAVMTGNDQVVTVTLTVNTTGTNGQLSQLWPGAHRGPDAPGSNAKLPALFGMFLAIAILGWSATRAKRPRYALALFALLVVLTGTGLTACTHSHPTSTTATVPGSYPVNVTASVGTGGTQTAVVMITIVKE